MKRLGFAASAALLLLAVMSPVRADPATVAVRPAPALAPGVWVGGAPTTIAAQKGRVTVLLFWTHGCINCKHNLGIWNDWARKYRGTDVTVLSVHTPETAEEHDIAGVRRFVRDWNLQFPVLTDNSEQTWDAYGVEYWPSEFLIDKQGRIRYRFRRRIKLRRQRRIQDGAAPDREAAEGAGMTAFTAVSQDRLILDAAPLLSEMYTFSPFVWQDGGRWEMLMRAVPRRDVMPALKIARIYYGRSEDGLRFTMRRDPVIALWSGGEHREKRGVRLSSTPEAANPTEVTIVHVAVGTWRLFFEDAAAGASKIGLAFAPRVDGPWTVPASLFGARSD